MGRGGARAGSGPAPNPLSLRTYRRLAAGEVFAAGWVVLPAAGRPGDPPDWPLPEADAREMWHWARLWRTPQATEWERLGQVVEVALYVRRLAEVEKPDASAALANLVVRLGESLGLTLPGLRARQWQLGAQEGSSAAIAPIHASEPPRQLARDRLSQQSARDRIARLREEAV